MAVQIPIALLAGLISVITPCVLPLVPGYLSAVSAVEVGSPAEDRLTRRIVAASTRSSSPPCSRASPSVTRWALFARARDRYNWIRWASGATLVALGLLLFFHRDWRLHVALNRDLDRLGLATI